MADNTTAKFSVDISDLKKGIQEANRQIKLANAEFKAASASMDKWSTSTDGLTAKINQTEKVLQAQKKILNSYAEELKVVIAKYGENSKEADNMKIKYENQRAAVIKSQKALGDYEKALEALEKEQKAAAEAANKQDTAYEALEKTIKAQKSDLESLKSQYASVVLEQGKNSSAAKDLAKQISELSSDLNENNTRMREADAAADELDNSLADTAKAAADSSDGFTVMKGALADLVSAGIQKAVEGLKDLAKASYQAWQEYDAGADSIIAATGATGEAAEELVDVYKNVSKNVVASYDDIGTAVGEINTRFGSTGDELQDLSEQFIKFKDLNGVDLKNAIDKTQSAMAAWGVEAKDASLMLDLLNKAGQDTGESADSLAASLTSNAPALQEMGFNVSDAAMFLANLSKNGVDASSTMAGLKKALANAAAEGTPMNEALAEMEQAIKSASTSTEAITTATELFGNKAGAAIATAVRQGNLSFAELGTSIEDFEGSVNTTFEATQDAPDKFAKAIQGIKTDFADLVSGLMDEYGPEIEELLTTISDEILPTLKEGVEWFIDNLPAIEASVVALTAAVVAFNTVALITKIVESWNAFKKAQEGATAAQWLLNAAMSANPIGLIVAGIAALVAAFLYLWNTSEDFRNFWLGLWEYVKIAVFAAIETIKATFMPLIEFFQAIWEQIKEPLFIVIGLIVAQVQQSIMTVVTIVKTLITVFTTVWNKIKQIFSGVKSYFVTVFTGAVDAVKSIIEGLVGIVKSVINTIIRGINTFINGLNNIKIPDWVPGIGGGQLHIPNIPELARGGVLKQGQLGLLEGSGAEAVVPLENNKKWIQATARAMKQALIEEGIVNAAAANVQQPTITNNYNFTQNNTSPKALSAVDIYRQTNSLLFNAEARLSNV